MTALTSPKNCRRLAHLRATYTRSGAGALQRACFELGHGQAQRALALAVVTEHWTEHERAALAGVEDETRPPIPYTPDEIDPAGWAATVDLAATAAGEL